MKRYALFAGDQHYPRAAFGDFKDSFNTVEEAKDDYIKRSANYHYDWMVVVDLTTGREVYSAHED